MANATSDASMFVDTNLFEAVPFIFGSDQPAYLTWRREAARLLEVDPRNLLIVGSGARGFSIKNGRDFRASSDVDLAVVSSTHFDAAWWFLRTTSIGTLKCTSAQRAHIRDFAPKYVYRGCIATDHVLPLLPFGASWQKAAARLGNELPASIGSRVVNFRLYRDIEALRGYQEYSHTKFPENWSS